MFAIFEVMNTLVKFPILKNIFKNIIFNFRIQK
jgi:hypothetical protein